GSLVARAAAGIEDDGARLQEGGKRGLALIAVAFEIPFILEQLPALGVLRVLLQRQPLLGKRLVGVDFVVRSVGRLGRNPQAIILRKLALKQSIGGRHIGHAATSRAGRRASTSAI